jgi:hypothetical protein
VPSLEMRATSAEHEEHSTTRTIFHENGAEGRQRCLPTVQSLRKQPRLGLDELKREDDLRTKLRGRPSATRASDTGVPMRSSVNERGMDDDMEAVEEDDSSEDGSLEEDDAAYNLADKRANL